MLNLSDLQLLLYLVWVFFTAHKYDMFQSVWQAIIIMCFRCWKHKEKWPITRITDEQYMMVPIYISSMIKLRSINTTKINKTSKHSSRMRTVRHQMPAWGGVSWSQQVWTGLQWWKPAGRIPAPCLGRGVLYSEVQCIMGNGHMGHPPPCGQTGTHQWKHYLPTTSLAGGNNFKKIYGLIKPCLDLDLQACTCSNMNLGLVRSLLPDSHSWLQGLYMSNDVK